MNKILILLTCLCATLWSVAYAVFDILAFRAGVSLRLAAVAAFVAAFGIFGGIMWCLTTIAEETDEESEEEDNNDE